MFSKAFLLDVLERSLSTFVQTFAAVLVIKGDFTLLSLEAAAVAAGLAVLKGIAATQFGNKNSASLVK